MNKKVKIIHLEAGRLRIHPTAQKQINPTVLNRVMSNLDPEAVGVIHVVYYPIGGEAAYWVIDGQHRLTALLRLGFSHIRVACLLHEGVTDDARASDLFLKLNDRGAVRPFDKFANRVAAGDVVAVNTYIVAAKHGLEVSNQAGEGKIICPDALMKAYLYDQGESLDGALGILTNAFGYHSSCVEGKLVEGLSLVLSRNNGNLDHAALTKKLSKYEAGAGGIIGSARAVKKFRPGTTIGKCVAEVICEIYNSGRRDPNKIAV